MAESKVIAFVIRLWKIIVCWYDASFVSRAIDGVCDFFIKNADTSVAVKVFRHGAFGGEWWKNSLAYKAMALPLSGRKERLSFKSSVIDGILDIFNIPLKSIGAILLSYSLVMLGTISIR